ncbi:family 78 glycoside hydrolase catalytic domain, partial [Actinomyces ruminicola]|uniref:family 78 glycoside hydrolase catalytic domain n=1 Tax=Actinomyces ruminicola TaxID=332524 RepID=UPI00159FA246
MSYATAADRGALNFSWTHQVSATQTAYRVVVYARADQSAPVFTSTEVTSSDQTSVVVPGLVEVLADNQLYYWQVTVRYDDGTTRTSARSPFVTAVGSQWASTGSVWSSTEAVSTLVRGKVILPTTAEKVILSATALDTEVAKRHVFAVSVNGAEIGVGPTRRAGTTLYYNAYDITDAVIEGENVVGLMSYTQAASSGVLMQVTAYYSDGTSGILYNSARDTAATEVRPMDAVLYGGSGASIGTSYYTELAQNTNAAAFPFTWQDPGAFGTGSGWTAPAIGTAFSAYTLAPSIVENTVRSEVTPTSATKNSDGSWTIAFDREIIGDIRLRVTAPSRTAIRIQLGEELAAGKARSAMRTGNNYDETWTFRGTDVTWTGSSLKAFRYVTLSSMPGVTTSADVLARVRGVQTSIPTTLDGAFNSDSELLNRIAQLGGYSLSASIIDTYTDSVTRERRPYEGDLLITQALSYAWTRDDMAVRNTWNWLVANPSQYTEYRLMAAIGVHEDYLRTADSAYAAAAYPKVKALVEDAIQLDVTSGLVSSQNGRVDLVDWPRTEMPGYDISNTRYKTVINLFAVAAYESLSDLATVAGNTADAAAYGDKAVALRASILSTLYDSAQRGFSDGLTSSRTLVKHYAVQNNYVALALGVYSDQSMAEALAESTARAGAQQSGSIYMAYFLYRGLYRSGNGEVAISLLTKTNTDTRTYNAVLSTLGATISPEAWSPSTKPNMTYSHPWGSGGPIALVEATGGVTPTSAGYKTADVAIQELAIGSVSTTAVTPRGPVTTSADRNGAVRTLTIDVPSGIQPRLVIDGVGKADAVVLDGTLVRVDGSTATGEGDRLYLQTTAGTHTITLTDTLTVTVSSGQSTATAQGGEKAALYAIGGLDSVQVDVAAAGIGIQLSAADASGRWGNAAASGERATAPSNAAIAQVKASLTGKGAAQHTVRYRVLSPQLGWTGWASDGAAVGVVVTGGRISAVQLEIVPAGTAAPLCESGRPAVTATASRGDLLTIRRGGTYYFRNTLTSGVADRVIAYGRASDAVLMGDWDGDGVDTLAVRRRGTYYIKNSISGGQADRVIVYGRASDQVLVGDW